MASTPQPGTSFGGGGNNDSESPVDEVDISILEVESPGLSRLLEDNDLKIVSKRVINNRKNNHLEEECKSLKKDVSKLKTELSAKQKALDEASEATQRIPRLVILNALENKDKTDKRLQEQDEKNKREVDELKRKLNEAEEKAKKSEETVKDINLKLRQAEKEKEKLEKKFDVERKEFQKKLKVNLEDRTRRGNEIIALKDEKERLTADRFRFTVFFRNLANQSGIPCDGDETEIGSASFLENLSSGIQELLEKRDEERAELTRNRDLLNKLESLFVTSRSTSSNSFQQSSIPVFTPDTSDTGETRREAQTYSSSHSNNTLPPTPARSSFSSITPPTSPGVNTLPRRLNKKLPNSPSTSSKVVEKPSVVTTPPQLKTKLSITSPVKVATITTVLQQQQHHQESKIPSSSTKQSVENAKEKNASSVTPSSSVNTTVSPPSQNSQPPSIVIPLITRDPKNTTPQRMKSPILRRTPLFSRNYKQKTEFVISTKRHGVKLVDKTCGKFICLCERDYKTEKCLQVHIRKMTKEWKYKCKKCLQYFFYQCDLNRHLATSPECAGDAGNLPRDDNSINGGVDALLNQFLQMPPPPPPQGQNQQRPSPPPRPCASSSSTASSASSSTLKVFRGNRKGQVLRKLQQDILRKKKHAPWLSTKGTVQGSWYCCCGRKFTSKPNLRYHVEYYTKDWKFSCPHCHCNFFCLSYLKKHMMDNHKIPEPLKEFCVGCHLCGEMFRKRAEYYRHRKIVHNLHRRNHQGRVSGLIALPWVPNAKIPSVEMDVIDVSSDDEEITLSPVIVSPPTGPVSSITTQLVETTDSDSSVASSSSQPLRLQQQRHAPVERDPLGSQTVSQQQHLCTCGKPYKSRTALNHHIKTMKYGRIYVCLKCSRGFTQLEYLKGHMSSIHKEVFKGFKCGWCGKVFYSSREFQLHCRTKHNQA